MRRPNGTGIFYVDVKQDGSNYTTEHTFAEVVSVMNIGAQIIMRITVPSGRVSFYYLKQFDETSLVFLSGTNEIWFTSDNVLEAG